MPSTTDFESGQEAYVLHKLERTQPSVVDPEGGGGLGGLNRVKKKGGDLKENEKKENLAPKVLARFRQNKKQQWPTYRIIARSSQLIHQHYL
jgi:hypothetical protein